MGFNGSVYQYLIIFQKGQLVCTTTYEEKTSWSENIYFYEAEISSRWAWNISWKLSTLLLVTKFYLFAESFYYKRKYVTLRISEIRDIFSPVEKGVSSLSLSEKCPYTELFWSAFSCIWTEFGGVSLHIQSECEKMWTIISPNTDTLLSACHRTMNNKQLRSVILVQNTSLLLMISHFG